jgi:hypothetical protein
VNLDDALIWLERAVVPSNEPQLADGSLELLLSTVAPGATSFDLRILNRAAALGWEWKANLAAEYNGTESEIYKHCVERQKSYSAKAVGGGSVVKSPDPVSVKSLL